MSQYELPYDFEDFGMNEEDLVNKYGDKGHPFYTLDEWRSPRTSSEEYDGYWDWVMAMINIDDEDCQSTEAKDEVVISSLDHFVTLLVDWHKRQVATLEHMQTIPAGTDIAVEGEDPFRLEGDVMRAFQMGVAVSLSHLGTLPFNAEFVDPDASKH